MDRVKQINPFSKRESHSPAAVITYKVLTILTWLLSVVVSVYYSVRSPADDIKHGRTIEGQNYLHWSGFTLNFVLVYVYFIVLFILQIGYVVHLFSSDIDKVNAACATGSHFIVNNLLHFAFIMLFVRSHFVWAELILIINFFNLSSMAFRHHAYARFIHTPVVSGPLAWTFVAIYWNGAIMVPHEGSLVARIFANIFVWSILVYGLFFIAIYKDYTMGFWLSVLAASLGVAQFQRQFIAFQWIFAFVIMAVLFSLSAIVAAAAWTGRELHFGRDKKVTADAERAPLLADDNQAA
ncbi:ATP synthase F0 [Diaporthe amygdali]|uniref:ATP synthase F0 n=1 Tax=Phomopsis amygdali TaxID=1214568 RepID=UPI0022FE31D7|nr:ATP synthase F0 [Diaporthe amygdali]KAJ0113845.1 ATP synthase F0 [Diaporthe amygdali]